MKILIANDAGMSAHYFERMGLARAFTYAGHEVTFWETSKKSIYDSFDEANCDLFIGQTYNINDAFIKCIEQRPFMKVILKASDYGDANKVTIENSPIVRCSQQELYYINKLREVTGRPDGLFIHYHPDYLEFTHGEWMKEGYHVFSSMNAADLFDYVGGKHNELLSCDISFLGNYWPYKASNMNKYFSQICSDFKYRIRIFGGGGWPYPQHMGYIDTKYVKDLFFSSKINLCLSEPHSIELGYDVTEKCYKLASNKSFFIGDEVEGTRKLFGDSVVLSNPEDFLDKIEYYLSRPEERQKHIEEMYGKVIAGHTYFCRAANIMSHLGLENESKEILDKKRELLNKISPNL